MTANTTNTTNWDKTKIYVYTGPTDSANPHVWVQGNWYYWNGSAWVIGGVYNETAIETDKTLTLSNVAADAKVAGDKINELKSDLTAHKNGEDYLSITWELGTIDASGNDATNNTAIRTMGYIDLAENPGVKIHTDTSIHVYWYWYDENKTFLSNASATINGDYSLTYSAYASYVRFACVTIDSSNVHIIVNSQAITAIEKANIIAEAHNQNANGAFEFIGDWEIGYLDTSTGEETINNLQIRTGFIDKGKYHIKGYLADTSPGLRVYEYDSEQAYIKSRYYNTSGNVDFVYDANTVYIRIARPPWRDVRILQETPFVLSTEKQQILSGISTNISDINNLSERCVHHDNFSRTETNYEIGKNSEGSLTDNSYDTVTGATSDDGVRVDYGLAIAADSSRSDPFTVRKINASHGENFMVEFNAPSGGQGIYIIYKLTDALNFEGINVSYNGTYYGCIQRTIANGAFRETIETHNIYNATGYVFRLYFIGGIIAVFIDDRYCCRFYADSIDDYIYIGAYRGVTAQFDFINMFDLIVPLVYNTAYLTDNNVSALPKSTISANADRYALDGTNTRFSEKSEKFMLYSTDEKISNGRRTERSLVALLQNNLRTMRYEFDVYFPSSILPDTDAGGYADIFFQLHDRQSGVARGAVPFHLSLVGNKIKLTQCASATQAAESLDVITSGFDCGEVTYDQWMHFELYIKERYEVGQHPFMELRIDGKVVYQSRKPNCANDVNGASAQYGEYKNNWDLIAYSERYIDNFKVTY